MPSISRRLFTGAVLSTLAGCAAPRPRRGVEPPPPALMSTHIASTNPLQAPPAPPAIPLFQAHPALGNALPHVRLGLFPTPVESAPGLGAHLGLGSLWVKRDDASGRAYGGGKVRKLEFLLGESVRLDATSVITSGGAGSNHAVATSIYGAELGLRILLWLLPEPADDRVRENLLAALRAGAEIRIARGHEAPSSRHFGAITGDRPHVIPRGGTSPLGNAGFVNAAFELAAQIERREMPEPRAIYLAMGTMGSAAGLAVGLRAAGLRSRVVAVRASSPATSSEARFLAEAEATVKHLRGLDPSFPAVEIGRGDIVLSTRHLGPGYARPTAKALRAVRAAREHGGLSLEHVYTGKALAALADDARRLTRDVVLFWNSHNGCPLDIGDEPPRDIPECLRGYFPLRDR